MNPLALFTPAEIEELHQQTLRILAETGVALNEPQSCGILADAGAKLEAGRVLLPPELVERCIDQAGKRTAIRGRDGAVKTLGDGLLYFHNLGGAPQILDAASGIRRPARLEDVRAATRLLDALANCHTITPFFTPTDVPGGIMSLAMYRASLPFTTKPLQGPGVQFAAEVRYAVRMAQVLGDPAEILTLSLSPVSPLSLPDHEALAILEIARLGIAFGPLPCPTAGTTAPLSIAGAVTQQNAEVLSALVLAEVVHPGLPIIYCGRLAMMEPRTGLSVWGGVELGLASALTVQLGHRYGLPVNVYGFSTNAHGLDAQNGFERALNAVLPALAGADELSGIGEMEAGVMGSFAQMVVDDEFAGSILRIRQGAAPHPEAPDLIASVLLSNRNFLAHKHTRTALHSGELFLTRLAERGSWEAWERDDRKGMVERAQAEAERILREHRVPPLEDAQEKELDGLLTAAEKEMSE